jgi:hypothetical protein
VTAPRDVTGRLMAVAAWEAPLLRRAVGTLTAVAERLAAWRARLEGVARSLDTGETWSGPAARGTAAAVRELSSVTWSVDAALTESLTAFERLAAEAGAAQELAQDALALAAALPGAPGAVLRDAGRLAVAVDALVPGAVVDQAVPALRSAEDALDRAAAAAAAADRAGSALVQLGVRDAFSPADFAALAARVPVMHPVCVLPPPAGRPEDVAAWWAALPLAAQLAAIRADPFGLGNRDGLPAWARDRANRLVLSAALRDEGRETYARFTARVVARRIAAEEAAGHQVQLQLLDLAGDRVALGLGDIDTADAVAVLVPGIFNTPGDDLGRLLRDARGVAEAARAAAPGLAVASVVWLGYDSPGSAPQILGRARARDGGAALAGSLAGLRAARRAAAGSVARITVLAHSYGSVVADEAADEPGRLAADALVLLGSPGVENDARGMETPEVYDAASPDDLVAGLGWFGTPTGFLRFGSTALPVDPDTGHSEYFDADRPTLAAMGQVVVGVRTPG